MRWLGMQHAFGAKRNPYKILMGVSEGKRPLEKIRSTWRIILKGILERQDGVVWTGFIWLRIGTIGELL
jgi:hypothetical protein